MLTYKYIQVARDKDLTERAGRPVWYIFNSRQQDVLGCIEYYSAWRRWIFVARESSVWSTDCLADVQDAIKKITAGDI
jgi:hypothetical protein